MLTGIEFSWVLHKNKHKTARCLNLNLLQFFFKNQLSILIIFTKTYIYIYMGMKMERGNLMIKGIRLKLLVWLERFVCMFCIL